MQLDDKVAIVTGGGSGIGRAMATGLAGEGTSVVVADVDSDRAVAVAAELEESGAAAIAFTVDVSQSEQVDAMIEAAVNHFGRLDILINNAGRAARGFVSEMADEAWDSVIGVNLARAGGGALRHYRQCDRAGRDGHAALARVPL